MISAVIAVYNRPVLVKRAIDSVLNQSLSVDEIIVVDDGSTDDTLKTLLSFGDKIDIITGPNMGVSSARNRGILKAKGRWIAFLDSDDIWHRDKIKTQIEFHKNHKDILFSHTQEEWIRGDKIVKQRRWHKKPEGINSFKESLKRCLIGASTVMMAREIFDEIGLFDESLKVCEDFDLWLRVLRRYRLGLIDKELTTKYAEDRQLSREYHSMDYYRIKALLKHKELKIVRDEISKKLSILQKGAIKHKNSALLKEIRELNILKI